MSGALIKVADVGTYVMIFLYVIHTKEIESKKVFFKPLLLIFYIKIRHLIEFKPLCFIMSI